MFLLEFEGKQLFKKYGIKTPKSEFVHRNEVFNYTPSIAFPLVIKGQYPTGGRGKAGAVKKVYNLNDFKDAISKIVNIKVGGHLPEYILLEEFVEHDKEYYLGIIMSRFDRKIILLTSKYGGIDIEELATRKDGLLKIEVDPLIGISTHHLRNISLYLTGNIDNKVMTLVNKLYEMFINEELLMVEINPLVLLDEPIALDSKVLIDENSSVRKDLKSYYSYKCNLTHGEQIAREYGFSYVPLGGDIAIIGNGAGLVMATMDLVDYYGGKVGCFLDVGGGASPERVSKAIELVLNELNVKAIFLNIFAGITRCDEVAKGVLEQEDNIKKKNIKIVIRMVGTNEEVGRKMLEDAGYKVFIDMDEAAKEVVK